MDRLRIVSRNNRKNRMKNDTQQLAIVLQSKVIIEPSWYNPSRSGTAQLKNVLRSLKSTRWGDAEAAGFVQWPKSWMVIIFETAWICIVYSGLASLRESQMVDAFLCPDIWLGLWIQSMIRECEWQLFSLSWKGISELFVASLNLCAAFYIFAGVMDMGSSLTLQWVSILYGASDARYTEA